MEISSYGAFHDQLRDQAKRSVKLIFCGILPWRKHGEMSSEALECSICCERFDDQMCCPRLLSCGHSFCSKCLEKLLSEKAINCPTCRNAVSVPAGVVGLPKNFSLLDILLTLPQNEDEEEGSPICETCDDDQHPATSCCLDCKEKMCKDAARWHVRHRAFRDHRVVLLEELKANPKLAAVPVFCSEHNEQFRFFDEDCGHVVCRDCVTLKHNGHKCLSLAEAVSKYRQEMEALVTKASTQAEEIKGAETKVEGVSLELKQAYEKEAALLQATFVEVVASVKTREQVLMSELDNIYKTNSLTLTEQRDRLRIFQACLESAVQRANTAIQSPGNTELLVARSDIVSTLGALERQPPDLEPQSNSILKFSFDLGQLPDLLRKLGFVSGSTGCAADTTATGSGLNFVVPGQEASFTITAHDSQGRKCSVGGDLFVAELKQVEGEKKVEANVKDNGDGTYLATYTAPADTNGNYTMSVLLHGSHIQGSPFASQFVPVGRVNCYKCGQRRSASMMYYKNGEPHRSDSFRVEGFSALCYHCRGYSSSKPSWVFICGPC
ncbi:tripartite motif-containing protein 3-like isoform X1 [Montipora foliosa]|uniref:tripartite motif-containing protein 3-like isoform X1 n=2 Tax=Montipora foliosa TaxID=591990 RepID=UPI0035F10731